MTLPLHGFPDWQTSLRTADLASINLTQVLNPGNATPFSVFDFRAYSSYSVAMQVKCVNPATAFDLIDISLNWTSDATGLIPIFRERYQIFADSNLSVGFPANFGRFDIQDAVHGPYFYIAVTNSGVDAVNLTISVLGNSRSIGRRYVSNQVTSGSTASNADFGQLASINTALGAGASTQLVLPLCPGQISMRQQAVTAPMVMQLLSPAGISIQGWNIAAGVELHSIAGLPRSACRAIATNGGGVGGTAVWEITSMRDNW